MIKAVIFDMDGLMFDTETLVHKYYRKAGADYGYDIPESLLKTMIGRTRVDTEKITLDYFGNDFPLTKIRKKTSVYIDEYIKNSGVPKKKGLNEILDFCKSSNLKLAVATSTGRKKAEMLLSSANIINYFDSIVCGDEVTKGKPDPEIYLAASTKLNVSPNECAVLEDSKYGIMSAGSARMRPIFVPDLVAEDEDIRRNAAAKCASLDKAIPIISKWAKL